MIKKLSAVLLSMLMLCSGVPSFAAAKNPVMGISDYFDASSEDAAQKTAKPKKQNKKRNPSDTKVDPQMSLKNYFDDNEQMSSTGGLPNFEKKQRELAAYIRNTGWRTRKGLSKSDRAFVAGLIELGKFALMWASLFGFDKLSDALEAAQEDQPEDKRSVSENTMTQMSNIFGSMDGEDLSIDKLYTKIQHNAFYLLIIDGGSFKQVVAKYPEVAYLFDDLYTFFRWRYEMRSRVPAYGLNENNINVIFRTATFINSFVAWWELANVAKSEMALAVANPDDYTSLIPFTTRSQTEERYNIRAIYQTHARRARYYGRVWNNMQDYAAKARHMEIISEQDKIERGINSVAKPVRGRKASVRKAVFDALRPLSDQQVYQAWTDMRQRYVEMRARSEQVWRQYMKEQVLPLVKQTAVSALKVDPEDGEAGFKAEDLLGILELVAADPQKENESNEAKSAEDAALENAQNLEEAQESAAEVEASQEMQKEVVTKEVVNTLQEELQQ